MFSHSKEKGLSPSVYIKNVSDCLEKKKPSSVAIELTSLISEKIRKVTGFQNPQNISVLEELLQNKSEGFYTLLQNVGDANELIHRILFDEEFRAKLTEGVYLDLLKNLLNLFYKNKLPFSSDKIETEIIQRIHKIINLEEITENKLLDSIRKNGSLEYLCEQNTNAGILVRLENKASEIDKSLKELTEWLCSFLEISANHTNVNRDIFARLPLVVLIAKWKEIQTYLEKNLPRFANIKLSQLTEIDCEGQEFTDLSLEQKKEFYHLIRSLYQPLLQVGYYMSAFLNKKQCNFVETENVFNLLGRLNSQYLEFEEREKIVANNNHIAVILDHKKTLNSPETKEKILCLFEKNIKEVLEVCSSFFDIEKVEGSLETKILYIANAILPKLVELDEYPEMKELIIPVTSLIHLFTIASKEIVFFETSTEKSLNKEELKTELEKLLSLEFDYLKNLIQEKTVMLKKEDLKFRNEFASSYCDLMAVTIQLEEETDSTNYIQNISVVCQICEIPYPKRMLEYFFSMAQKITSKVHSMSESISLIKAVFCSNGQEAVQELRSYIDNDKKDLKQKVADLNTLVSFLNQVISLTMKEFDVQTSVHCDNVALSVNEFMFDASNILNIQDLKSSENIGIKLLQEMAQVLQCDAQSLYDEYSNYFEGKLTDEQIESYKNGAQWHDIGKIGVMPHILLFPGRLSAEQFDFIKKHTKYGVNILENYPDQIVKDIVGFHHEKWDGTGYLGLRDESIPKAARITAFADVWNALTEKRVYNQQESCQYDEKEMFMRGVVIMISDISKFCPFVFKVGFARLGLNIEKMSSIIGDQKIDAVIQKGELLKNIKWEKPAVQKELQRIRESIEKPMSDKQKMQEEVAALYAIIEKMGIDVGSLNKLEDLWYNSSKGSVDDKTEIQNNVQQNIARLLQLGLNYNALATQFILKIDNETLEMMHKIGMTKNMITDMYDNLQKFESTLNNMVENLVSREYREKKIM